MRQSLGLAAAIVVAVVVSGCGDAQVSSLEFVDVSPAQPRIGDIATLRFRAFDSRGLPMAGVAVEFELQSANADVVLSPDVATTNKGDGIASTQVISKTGRVFAVTVIAKAGDKQAVSAPFSFAGAVPSARQFTFQCGSVAGTSSGGVHAIGAYDSSRSMIAGVKLDCIAHTADRNGDGVEGVSVSFLTEAGTIGPTALSVSDVIGDAPVLYKTSFPLPINVAPETFSWTPTKDSTHTGDFLVPLWMEPFRWSDDPVANYGLTPTLQEPNRIDPLRPFDPQNPLETTMNPRDNLVAMIAVTAGEEGFSDNNNNGTYDVGEPFEDLTEPFVDSNDNGTWDPGERYIDTNNDGQWSGKNGEFDANTLIWVQERILWTGIPAFEDYPPAGARNPRPVVRVISPANPRSINIGHRETSPRISFIFADPWFNAPGQNSAEDGCSIEAGELLKIIPEKPGKQGVGYTYGAPLLLEFFLKDAHSDLAPAFPVPNGFIANVGCQFTASPLEGNVVIVPGPAFEGTVL